MAGDNFFVWLKANYGYNEREWEALHHDRRIRLREKYQEQRDAQPAAPVYTAPTSPEPVTEEVPPLEPIPTQPLTVPGVTSNGWFYDPSSQYGASTAAGDAGFANSEIGETYLEENPEAAWMRYAATQGIDPMSAQGKFARGLFPQVRTGFEAALATSPQLRQGDYFKTINIRNMFRNQSLQERGENPGLYAPAARTIARGYG